MNRHELNDDVVSIADWGSLPDSIELRRFGIATDPKPGARRTHNMQSIPPVIAWDVANAVQEERIGQIRREQLAAASTAQSSKEPSLIDRLVARISGRVPQRDVSTGNQTTRQVEAPQPR